jgi:hypothetical protein
LSQQNANRVITVDENFVETLSGVERGKDTSHSRREKTTTHNVDVNSPPNLFFFNYPQYRFSSHCYTHFVPRLNGACAEN